MYIYIYIQAARWRHRTAGLSAVRAAPHTRCRCTWLHSTATSLVHQRCRAGQPAKETQARGMAASPYLGQTRS